MQKKPFIRIDGRLLLHLSLILQPIVNQGITF